MAFQVPTGEQLDHVKACVAKTKPYVVAVVGGIGAGKTTLMPAIAAEFRRQGLSVCEIYEPDKVWTDMGALQQFYADPKKNATWFQNFVAVSRMIKTLGRMVDQPEAGVYIIERTMYDDRYIFAETSRELLGEIGMAAYEMWWDAWKLLVPIDPTHYVYLNPSIDKCMERVNVRAREGETTKTAPAADAQSPLPEEKAVGKGGVSREYQERIARAHEALYLGKHAGEFPGIPADAIDRSRVIVIDGDLANGDFTPRGEHAFTKRVVDTVVSQVLENVPADA
jgi:deoxyadenosine/deoxycytidine kinase